jgi:two-component system, cell cycle sensor histidine kinase and response regulator CckA
MPSTILVVDDEPGIRTMIQFELSQQGHSILTADSGAAALEVLKGAAKVDLILTDMRMPQMDGLDLVVQVRKALPDIPIVLMTGFVEDRVLEVQKYNLSATLNKPFTIDQLAEVVGKILGP